MTNGPNYERVAEIMLRVALRMTDHDESRTEGEVDVDTGVLPRLYRGTS
jgi:hypothetical protein